MRQRPRVHLDHTSIDPHTMRRELLGERRRGAAVLQSILEAVPGAGHEAVDDAAFADRAALVGAQIGERADLAAVAKYGDALAAAAGDDTGALVRD